MDFQRLSRVSYQTPHVADRRFVQEFMSFWIGAAVNTDRPHVQARGACPNESSVSGRAIGRTPAGFLPSRPAAVRSNPGPFPFQ
jgi:hypothetical protein